LGNCRQTWNCVRFGIPYSVSVADGTLSWEVGFATPAEAAARASDVEAERRADSFVDPRLAQTSVGEWVRQWTDAQE
jgi:hypothetical protein